MNKKRSLFSALSIALLLTTSISAVAQAQSSPRPTFGRTTPTTTTQDTGSAQKGTQATQQANPYLGVDGSAQRSLEQAQGNYPQMTRNLGLPLGTTQDAWSQPFNHMSQGQITPGVVRFSWGPELIMPIRIREFMVSMLVLPDWEEVTDVWLGENEYIQAQLAKSNVVALRTGASGIDSNITVVGKSGNLYTFYIRAESYNTRKITDINVFVTAPAPHTASGWHTGGFTTGQNNSTQPNINGGSGYQNQNMRPQVQAPSGSPATVGRPDFASGSYSYVHKMYEKNRGDGENIAPKTVYTDGRWTYFDFGEKAQRIDFPIIRRLVDGTEVRVNTRTTGDYGEILIAEATGDFVLRNGLKIVCVKEIKNNSTSVAYQ